MVNFTQIRKFREVKNKFDQLATHKRIQILSSVNKKNQRELEAMTQVDQGRLLFRLLYDPRISDDLIHRVERS